MLPELDGLWLFFSLVTIAIVLLAVAVGLRSGEDEWKDPLLEE